MIDNSFIVRTFIPTIPDGDTFLYTEILNRNKKTGNNKGRLEKTFYHRSRNEFDHQMADIAKWCDYTGARAYTRLGPRSFQRVGHKFFSHMTEQVVAQNWEGMRRSEEHTSELQSRRDLVCRL